MLIEIWSDVVCPFCYIGKRRLEAALADFEHRDEVEVVYRSFELDPSAPEVGTESIGDALARKYGGGPAETRAAMDRVAAMAAEVGLTFDYADATHTRTLEAHRLLHLALDLGGGELQRVLVEALMAAYFTQGRSMGDRAVLREVALGAGLPAERVDAVLAGDEYAAQVSGDIEQARAYGISGVPFFVLDRRLAVSGAQPQEVFAQALRQAREQAHEHAPEGPGTSSEVG